MWWRWLLVLLVHSFVHKINKLSDKSMPPLCGVVTLKIVCPVCAVQPVPKKMSFETVVGIKIGILNDHHRSFFKRLIWKETWTLTIQTSVLNSEDHFESRIFGNWLYCTVCIMMEFSSFYDMPYICIIDFQLLPTGETLRSLVARCYLEMCVTWHVPEGP